LNAIFARLFCQMSENGFLSNVLTSKMAVEVEEAFMTWAGCAMLVYHLFYHNNSYWRS
jgi:hypothetical protein